MGRKLEYEQVKQFIDVDSNSGCKLISEIYVGIDNKLKIKCNCGEIFETTFYNFRKQNKRHCDSCGIKNMLDKSISGLEDVSEEIYKNSNGMCRLISEDYNGNKKPIIIQCMHNHKLDTTLNSFRKSDYKCYECSKIEREKKNIMTLHKNIIDKARERNYEVIGSLANCKNNKDIYTLKCPNGHLWETSYSNFKIRNCRHCQYENMAISSRLDGKRIYDYFVNFGFIPQFQPEDYKNNQQLLPYVCEKHIEKGVQYTSYGNIYCGRGCYYCGREIVEGAKRLSQKEVFEFLSSLGLYPIDGEKYKNSSTAIKFRCAKHPNEIQELIYNSVQQGHTPCKFCDIENRSGENNYNWKGGMTPIHNYLRGKLKDWKNLSKVASNYKCDITGLRFDNIHHVYGFDAILDEIIQENNIVLKQNVSDYTEQELIILEEKCIQKHNLHIGVCLCNTMHELFHKYYGYGKNTPVQYDEFKKDYYNGKYDNELDLVFKSNKSIERFKEQVS